MNRPDESRMPSLSITDPLYMWIMAAQEQPQFVRDRIAELMQNDPRSIAAFLKAAAQETCNTAAAIIPFPAQPALSVPLKPQTTYESIPFREFKSGANNFNLHLVPGLFLTQPSGLAQRLNGEEIAPAIDAWNSPGKSKKARNIIRNGDLIPATTQDLKTIAREITTNPAYAPLRSITANDSLCIVPDPTDECPYGATYVDLKDGTDYWSSAGNIRANLVALQCVNGNATAALKAA